MGLLRACVKYSKAKGGVYRCSKYQKGKRHPTCPPSPKKNLRSAWAIHAGAQCAKRGKSKKSKSK